MGFSPCELADHVLVVVVEPVHEGRERVAAAIQSECRLLAQSDGIPETSPLSRT